MSWATSTREVTATGVRRRDGGLEAIWALSWPEQQAARINPVIIRAYYSAGAHHPHLQAGTAGDWPLNVFDDPAVRGAEDLVQDPNGFVHFGLPDNIGG